MKLNRVRLVGCGHRRSSYRNMEGYSDPTAGCAINGSKNIYAAPTRRAMGEKEKVVTRRLPPVSEMDAFLEAYTRKMNGKGRKMALSENVPSLR